MEIVQNNISTSLCTNTWSFTNSPLKKHWSIPLGMGFLARTPNFVLRWRRTTFTDKLVETSGRCPGIPFSKLWRYVPLSSLFRRFIPSHSSSSSLSNDLNHLIYTQPWSNLFSLTACLSDCWNLSESSWLFWLVLVLWFHHQNNLDRWIAFHWYLLLLWKELLEFSQKQANFSFVKLQGLTIPITYVQNQ